jgi:hypothetical protein
MHSRELPLVGNAKKRSKKKKTRWVGAFIWLLHMYVGVDFFFQRPSPSFISVLLAIHHEPNPSATKLRLCPVRGHMMPTKTSAGPKEVVRLEFLRLTPPLRASRLPVSLFF